jgi:hypothetical protein
MMDYHFKNLAVQVGYNSRSVLMALILWNVFKNYVFVAVKSTSPHSATCTGAFWYVFYVHTSQWPAFIFTAAVGSVFVYTKHKQLIVI